MTLRNDSLRYFGEAWNAVLNDMRMGDLLSNHELSPILNRLIENRKSPSDNLRIITGPLNDIQKLRTNVRFGATP